MKENQKNRRNGLHNYIKLVLAFLFAVLIPAGGSSAFTPVEISLPVRQTFLTPSGTVYYAAPSSVTYRLTASHPDTPLPAGASDGEYAITLTGNQQSETGVITITSPGVFEYTMTQVIPDNFIYHWTSQVFHITLYIKNDSSSMIVITNDQNVKVAEMAWTYTLPGTDNPDGSDGSGQSSGGGTEKPGPVTETTAANPSGNAAGDTASGETSEESVRTIVDILLEQVSRSRFLGGVAGTLAKTGDSSNRGLLGLVAGLSFFGFLILVFFRIRSSQDEQTYKNKKDRKN